MSGNLLLLLGAAWVLGSFTSLFALIENVSGCKKGEKPKKRAIVSGVIFFVLSLPILLALALTIGLSTGLVSM